MSQQDVWPEDQDHERLSRWGGQFHSIPSSHVSLRLPSDWPTGVHTRPSGLHPFPDCGGQSPGGGWTLWSDVSGNRWVTDPLRLLGILYLTSRGHYMTMNCLWPFGRFCWCCYSLVVVKQVTFASIILSQVLHFNTGVLRSEWSGVCALVCVPEVHVCMG